CCLDETGATTENPRKSRDTAKFSTVAPNLFPGKRRLVSLTEPDTFGTYGIKVGGFFRGSALRLAHGCDSDCAKRVPIGDKAATENGDEQVLFQSVHVGRAVGGHRNYWNSHCDAVAGNSSGARIGTPQPVCQQSETAWAGAAQLPQR